MRAAAALVASLAAGTAQAAATLHVDVVRSGAVVARDVEVVLTPGPGLALAVKRLEVDGSGYAFDDVRHRCTPEEVDGTWRCSGPLSARRDGRRATVTLSLAGAAGRYEARLARDTSSIGAVKAGDAPLALALANVPLAWLEPLVARVLERPAIGAGRVDAKLTVDGARVAGGIDVADVALDANGGDVGVAGLAARVAIDASLADDARTVDVRATLRGGEWLVAPLYVALPATPVELAVNAAFRDGAWTVPAWSWRDGDTLALRGSAAFARDASLQSLAVAEATARFPDAYGRYFAAALAPHGFGELDTAGVLRLSLDWRTTAPTRATFALANGRIADRAGRFSVQGLELDVGLNEPSRGSRVAWSGASVYAVPLGASDAELTLAPGDWRLDAPFAVAVLGGTLRLPALHRRVVADRAQWDAVIEIEGLSLAALAERFGWPAFGGTLSGRIPGLRMEGDVLLLDGGLALDVFGGKVTVSELAAERPFGVAPSLAADLVLEDLDLTALTQSFSFGQIDGKLDGRIANLRLVDWAPVAFDARLYTDRRYKGRERISQRAVNALSSVGGGAAAGLQQSLLKVFESFPYKAIGLSCRLANNVCEMSGLDRSGVDSENGGYTIVEGSGLPRLTVVGHQKRVDWPVLVARLKAATEGTTPVVQ